MRKALVVGINYYAAIGSLRGCVQDAQSVSALLSRNADASPNFGTRTLVANDASSAISRQRLKEAIRELFQNDSEIALLFFAGHGFIEATGGYLCGSDSVSGDDGLALSELMTLANRSPAKNRIILLDSCYSGIAGATPLNQNVAEVAEGVSILSASGPNEGAMEDSSGGVFTNLLLDALGGAAANLLGDVTPGSVYAHIDQSLGTWSQRPVFKTNVKSFVSLRRCEPPLQQSELRLISTFFPAESYEYRLDPSFEPTDASADAENCAAFALLQKYNRVNLLVPIGAPHMWHAAMESKAVRLTALGEHYRRLSAAGLI